MDIRDQEGADFYLGEQLFFKDLLGVMLVKSSNDAAMAVAKAVENKTKRRFPDLMNKKAQELDMLNSYFIHPAGLNDDAYSTAENLLKLVIYSKKYPEIWGWLALPTITITSIDGKNSHTFSSTNKLFTSLDEIVGGKTGYTDGALGCMILEVRISGLKGGSFLAIVLGSPSRFEDTKKLVEWGKSAFRWE